MNLLTIEHMTKAYSERKLLDDTGFSIQENEKIGVVGVNGMGKSTLLKILAGIEMPDEGKVIMGHNVKLGYLPQTPVFDSRMSLLQAVLSGTDYDGQDAALEAEAKAMLRKLGLPVFDQPMGELSGGQRKRAALASVLLKPVEILILDEPTNHLDGEMAQWLEDYLIRYRGALVMVTHDRYFLDRVSSRIVEVDKGKLYSYPGNYSKFLELKTQRQDMELATERKRQSMLRTELEWLARGARARSTKQKAHIQRIEEMQAVRAPQEQQRLEMNSMTSRMGKKTIELNGICKSYGERTLIGDFSYLFLKSDRVGIVGANGCGKTTLLKIMNGLIQPDSGTVEIGQTVKIGYFSQENESMDTGMKAIEYVREEAEYIQTPDGKLTASALMEQFLFDGTMQWTQIEKLSGGERRRLYLLRILMGAPNVLILDEPTNDLDIQTLEILEDYLDSFDGIVIAVSHDRYFLDRIVSRIFAFEKNGKLQQYEGNYSDYQIRQESRKAADMDSVQEKPEKEKTQRVRLGERKLKFSYKEEREYEVIDEEIANLEEKISFVESSMAKAASDYLKLNELAQEKESLEAQLEEKMDRWVYLNDLAEKIARQ